MQIDLIETFLDLMETRSFNRTAERLNITQSTVSHRVNALEAAFNRKLFTRGKGGTLPTAAALRLLDHAKALQQQWHEAARAVESAGSYERAIRIGIQHDVAEAIGGRFLKTARDEMPGTSIYLEADYSNQMNRDLGAGDLDLAVLYTPHHLPDLHYEQIGEIHYILVSTWAKTVCEIRVEDYIYGNYSPAFDRAQRAALPQFSAAPLAAGRNLILADILSTIGGAAYVTRATAHELSRKGVAHPVVDGPEIAQTVHAATNVRSRHAHQHRRLIAILAEMIAEG